MESENDNKIDFGLLLVSQRRIRFFVYIKIIFWPLLFYAFFMLSYFDIIHFKVENHTLAMMTVLLILAIIFAFHNADYACCVFENNIEKFKRELNSYIDSSKVKIGKIVKSNGNFSDFVENYSRTIRNENYSAVASSVFPMIGILGTFISIAVSMPDFKSSDVNGLESEIAQLLTGVATAFYVSIFGIFLSLWWTYFEKRGLTRYQKIIEKFENFSQKYFFNDSQVNLILLSELLEVSKENFELNKSEMQINNVDAFKEMSQITTAEIQKSASIIQESTKSQADILNSYNLLSKSMKEINYSMHELGTILQKELRTSGLNATVGSYEINTTLQSLVKTTKQLNYNLALNSKVLQKEEENRAQAYDKLGEELIALQNDAEKIINKFNTKKTK